MFCRVSPKSKPGKAVSIWKGRGREHSAVFAAFTQTAETERRELPLTWLGWRDSNPLYRSQSPVCYHYTTSQYAGLPAKTGRHSRPVFCKWGGIWGSNPRHPEPQSGALPTELIPPYLSVRLPTRPIINSKPGFEVVVLLLSQRRVYIKNLTARPRETEQVCSLAKHKAQRSGFVFERKKELTDV